MIYSRKKKAIVFVSTFVVALATLGRAYIDPTVEPMSLPRLLGILESHPEVTTLDQVPGVLPEDFLMNFILKHGVDRRGERGHLNERRVSQSADPLFPRAIIFDERSGFTLSYNGGIPTQTANQRLDILRFDSNAKTFHLEQIDFPIPGGHPVVKSEGCQTCHGPHHRPIFSMYPDWPAFYGSDNDELRGTTPVQKKEFADYRRFLEQTVTHHPRYAPLFSAARVRDRLGVDLYQSFPYRQDVSAHGPDISRAFTFRPALRMGLLYNRLTAQQVGHLISQHANFQEFGSYFLFNLLQCSWSPESARAKNQWLSKVQRALGKRPKTASGGLLDYRQALELFGLQVKDVDIRYTYVNEAYDAVDARRNIMGVGYIGRYFNSYFDGSATIDELLSAQLHSILSSQRQDFPRAYPRGLTEKYTHFAERFRFDETFFRQMDTLSPWLPIPYPQVVFMPHHRERFTQELAREHTQTCSDLEAYLR